jgi:GTP-binding protein EngB required for normal cell division
MAPNVIEIPVVGFKNAGKSTVIGALLQGEYSQTSLQECTNSAFKFLICETASGAVNLETISQIYSKIKAANEEPEIAAMATKKEIQDTSFEVRIRIPLCEAMKKNTHLQFIDLPGWSEASVMESIDCAAKNYVTKNWDTFACVLVVLDMHLSGKQGEKQLELLRCLHTTNSDSNVPIIILGNKVDSQNVTGMKENIRLFKDEIATIFNSSLEQPLFIPLAAKKALYFRCAQGLEFEQFKTEFKSKMDQIGSEIWPLDWDQFSEDEGLKKLFNSLSDKESCKAAMSARQSNFGELLQQLEAKVGGDIKQTAILRRVHAQELKKITLRKKDWVEDICAVSRRLHDIGVSDRECVMGKFWELHKRCCSAAEAKFDNEMDFSRMVSADSYLCEIVANIHLEDKRKLLKTVGDTRAGMAEAYFKIILREFNAFILSQNQVAGKKASVTGTNKRGSGPSRPSSKKKVALNNGDAKAIFPSSHVNWGDLTAFDWKRILRVQTKVPGIHFHFPRYGNFLDSSLESFGASWGLSQQEIQELERDTTGRYVEIQEVGTAGRFCHSFEFLPNDREHFEKYDHLPKIDHENASHAEHWGHIPWLFIRHKEIK